MTAKDFPLAVIFYVGPIMYHTSYFGHVATNQKLFPTFAVINDTLAPARTS